jgi:hypothetical protein
MGRGGGGMNAASWDETTMHQMKKQNRYSEKARR